MSNSVDTVNMKPLIVFSYQEPDIPVPLPCYKTAEAAGMDLAAFIPSYEGKVIIQPNSSELIRTNLRIALPKGLEGQVRSRSGLANKSNVFVLNSPGTIDSDYRGELNVILYNAGKTEYIIHDRDRIAQLIIAPVFQASVAYVDNSEFDALVTERGSNGFGSTGIS